MITHELEKRVASADSNQIRLILLIASDQYLDDAKSKFPYTDTDIDTVNYPRWKLEQLDDQTRFVPMSGQRLYEDLDKIANSSGLAEWVFLEGLDVPLAQIDETQRTTFWQTLFTSFRKRPRGLIIAFREQAAFLIPVSVRGAAEEDSYLVRR
jgi:hypothetical protein